MKRAMSSVENQIDRPGKTPKARKLEVENRSHSRIKNEYDSIWDQLKIIVNDLVSNGHGSVSQTEINDVLLVISQDPDKITFFDSDYGSEKVESAIKNATKLLYVNGTVDLMLSRYIWWKCNDLVDDVELSYLTARYNHCNWVSISLIARSLFSDFIFNIPQLNRQSLEVKAQRLEFTLLMAADPNRIREKTAVIDIGQSKVEIGISICTHILERMSNERLHQAVDPVDSFRQKRNSKIRTYWKRYLKNITPNHGATFIDVRCIVEKYWKNESPDQIDSFTILLIMEPKILHAKFLFFHNTPDFSEKSMSDIENQLKCCFRTTVDDNKFETKIDTSVDNIKEVSMPIIARLRFKHKRGQKKINRHLRLKLSDQHDESEISILFGLRNKIIVCANLQTLEWLTIALNDLQFNASIESATKLVPHQFITVNMLSSVRLNESFGFYMKQIKNSHHYLRTELWMNLQQITNDCYNLCMDIDVFSIAHLELQKCRITVDDLVLKFDIKY